MYERRDKTNSYLDVAETVLKRGTCLRRLFGAVIVKNDEIISTGYNGAPRGRVNCTNKKYCNRQKLNIPRGQRYELCCSVHAEANAIISAARSDMIGASLYLVGMDVETMDYPGPISCCPMCKRLVINAGIKDIYCRVDKDNWVHHDVQKEWVDDWNDSYDMEGY